MKTKTKKKHLPCITKNELIFRDDAQKADFKRAVASAGVGINLTHDFYNQGSHTISLPLVQPSLDCAPF